MDCMTFVKNPVQANTERDGGDRVKPQRNNWALRYYKNLIRNHGLATSFDVFLFCFIFFIWTFFNIYIFHVYTSTFLSLYVPLLRCDEAYSQNHHGIMGWGWGIEVGKWENVRKGWRKGRERKREERKRESLKNVFLPKENSADTNINSFKCCRR